MKFTIRIPTAQYAYIEAEFDGTAEEAFHEHDKMLKIYEGGDGLSTDEFNKALDTYLATGTGITEEYIRMNKQQQNIFQEIKKSINRQKNK